MILDIEITLNRFGFQRIQPNKFQIAFFRIAYWKGKKIALCVEINWRLK